MNFNLKNIPERTDQPRSNGLTMITDKGLSVLETEDLLSVAAPYIDIAKLAFGTSLVTPDLDEKIKVYQQYNIPVYLGGLLLEAFIVRGQLQDYFRMVEVYDIKLIEVSDGSITIPHTKKCEYIKMFSKERMVLSEVGSKDKDKVQVTPPYKWIE